MTLHDDPNVGTGLAASAASEDVLRLKLRIDEDGLIEEVDYKIFGRDASIESANSLPLILEGLGVNDILAIGIEDIDGDFVYAGLVIDAVRLAVADYLMKSNGKM